LEEKMADEIEKNSVLEKRLKDKYWTYERKNDVIKGTVAGTTVIAGSFFGPEIREKYNSIKPETKERIVDYSAGAGAATVVGLFAYALTKLWRNTYKK
jgi:hypothetical protein